MAPTFSKPSIFPKYPLLSLRQRASSHRAHSQNKLPVLSSFSQVSHFGPSALSGPYYCPSASPAHLLIHHWAGQQTSLLDLPPTFTSNKLVKEPIIWNNVQQLNCFIKHSGLLIPSLQQVYSTGKNYTNIVNKVFTNYLFPHNPAKAHMCVCVYQLLKAKTLPCLLLFSILVIYLFIHLFLNPPLPFFLWDGVLPCSSSRLASSLEFSHLCLPALGTEALFLK